MVVTVDNGEATSPPVPSASEVLRRIRRTRSTRRSFRQRTVELFENLLYVGMTAGLVVGLLRSGFEGTAAEPAPFASTGGLITALSVLVMVVAATLVLKAFVALGPILVSAAEQYWILSTPAERKSVLRLKFWGNEAVAIVGGTVLFTVILLTGGLSLPEAVPISVLVSSLLVGLAILLQAPNSGPRYFRPVTNFLLAFCVLLFAVLVAVRPSLTLSTTGPAVLSATLVVLAICAFVANVNAYRRLGAMERAGLSKGAELALAVRISTTFLDGTILSSVITIRWARSVGKVRSVRLRGRRFAALVRADWLRIRRKLGALAVWAALLPVPYAAQLLGIGDWVGVVQLVAAFVGVHQLTSGLRQVCRSSALRHAIGGTDGQLRLAHLVVPAAGTVIWCALTAPAVPTQPLVASAISLGGALLASYRIATKPPMEYYSPTLDIGFLGTPIPIGLAIQLMRGPLLLVVIGWLQLLAISWMR